MEKKKITFILVGLLAVILAVGVLVVGQTRRQQAQAEAKAQQEEELAKQQAALALEQKKKEEEAARQAEEEAKARETISVIEEEPEEAQVEEEGEAQIHKPEGYAESGTEGLADLKAQLEGMTAGYEGDYSIYVYDLGTDTYLESNSHAVKAASLIKLYIMAAVLEQIEAGNVTADDTLHQLLVNMITVSDNESSNELVRRLSADGTNHEEGMAVVNAFAAAYGYGDTSQGRDLRDFREVPAAGENYTSVRDCGLFLKRVYDGVNVSAESSAVMLELLKQQTRTWKIPAGVPAGVVTANKTGELSDTENDVAIVYSPATDYILCVTSTGLGNPGAAQANIAAISSVVYQYFNN